MTKHERTETVEDLKNHKGTPEQEIVKKHFFDVVRKGCPVGDQKDYLFSLAMMIAFIAGRAFEANR